MLSFIVCIQERKFYLICQICESSLTFRGSGVFSSSGVDRVQGHGRREMGWRWRGNKSRVGWDVRMGAGCQGGPHRHEIKKKMQCDTRKINRRASQVWFKQPRWLLNCTDCFLASHLKKDLQKMNNQKSFVGFKTEHPYWFMWHL